MILFTAGGEIRTALRIAQRRIYHAEQKQKPVMYQIPHPPPPPPPPSCQHRGGEINTAEAPQMFPYSKTSAASFTAEQQR